MKKNKIIVLLSLSMIGNIFVPWGGAIAAHAVPLKTATNRRKKSEDITNGIMAYKVVQDTKIENKNFAATDYEIKNSKININNVWNQSLGNITFNTNNETIKFSAGWSEINPYLGSREAFGIYIYNKNGKLLRDEKFYGKHYPESKLSKLFNNLKYQYGDIIRINRIASTKITFENNGKSKFINGDIQLKINKSGLVETNMPTIKVNPFYGLGNGENPLKNGVITGATAKPDSKVNIEVAGKTFTGISNEKGNFTIKVTDLEGFSTNPIFVSTNGELTNILTPEVNPKYEINNTFIAAVRGGNYNKHLQTLSFNTANMTLSNSGYGDFAIQLLNEEDGKVLADEGTGNYNAFTPKNNINGAKFKYGNILSVYEPTETANSLGNLIIKNGDEKPTSFDTNGKFNCFTITSNGLVKILNKNLEVSKAIYTGNPNVEVEGKGIPNTTLKISYDGKTENVKTDMNGNFKIEIPFSKVGIEKEIRIFENNENIKVFTIQYDSNLNKMSKNKIEILNDVGFPLFNINFNPAENNFNISKTNGYQMVAGVFYGNYLDMEVLDPKSNKVIYNFTNKEVGNEEAFINQIQGKKYNLGDIIKISYNKNYTSLNVFDGEKNIGNSTGETEYFKITNSGLVNISNEYKTNKAYLNEAKSINNSYINFYNKSGWSDGIQSSINFNGDNKQFIVNNYSKTFGKGNEKYFTLSLYNSEGNNLWDKSFVNGETTQLSEFLNGKSFEYGDIIGLEYNTNISKPVILNGKTSLGNITGQEEYFEITENGLKRVNLKNQMQLNNISWGNDNLIITSDIGSKSVIKDSQEKMVIINSDKKIVGTFDTSVSNQQKIIGVINNSELSNIIKKNKEYSIEIKTNNGLVQIYGDGSCYSNKAYTFSNNSEGGLTISLAKAPLILVNNSNDIKTYQEKLNSLISQKINKNSNIEEFMKDNEYNQDLITNTFILRVGVNQLEDFYNKSEGNANFVNWVLNNTTAMQEYLNGTSRSGISLNGLQVWADIWNTYSDSRSGFNLKLAIATGISNANAIMAWPSLHYYDYGDRVNIGNPVERYKIFETLNSNGQMLPMFRNLNVKFLEYVVNTRVPNNQLLELRNIILENHNGDVNVNDIQNIAYTITYNMNNPHTGQSVDSNSDFYGPHPNIANVWYDGGVCYSIANLGAVACQVFGMPALPVTQDDGEHKVFLYYSPNKGWNIGNNIFGWGSNMQGDISGWSQGIASNADTSLYSVLYAAADTSTLNISNEYLWLGQSNISYESKMNAFNEAIKLQPLNLPVWIEKINLMKTDSKNTIEDYINLSNSIMKTFNKYPLPMYDLLLQIKTEILQKGTTEEYNTFVNNIKKTLEMDPTQMSKQLIGKMPQDGFKNNEIPFSAEIRLSTYNCPNTNTITFNNGTITSTGEHKWIGSSSNDKFEFNLYTSDRKLIKSVTAQGDEFGGNQSGDDLSGLINGLKYSIGDIITISYTPGDSSNGKLYFVNKKLDTTEVSNNVSFKITKDGLTEIPFQSSIMGEIRLSTWGCPNTNTIIFKNGTITSTGEHKWIGSLSNDKFEFNLYTSDRKLIKSVTAQGDEFGGNQSGDDLSGLINGLKYSIGDIITISYTPGDSSNGKLYFVNRELDAKEVSNNISFKITKDGLIEMSSQKVNKIPLEKAIILGKSKLVSGNYTKKSVQALNKAILNGENELKNINLTSTEVKSYTNNIINDIKNLQINLSNKVKDAYFKPYGLVINVEMIGTEFDKNIEKDIVIKNDNGKEISIKGVNVNWYSSNKNNYNGVQFIITQNQLGEIGNANLYIKVTINGEKYEIPLNIEKNQIPKDKYGLPFHFSELNNKAVISTVKNIGQNDSIIKDEYYEKYGLVVNTANSFNNKILTKNEEISLIVKNSKNEIIDTIKGVNVDWYSHGNYSGAQFIITNKKLYELRAMKKSGEKFTLEVAYKNNSNDISLNF